MQHTSSEEVEAFLNQCGLSQYYETFIEEGFDRPESVKIEKNRYLSI